MTIDPNGLYAKAMRYEKVRRLNPREFKEIWENCLKNDIRFDDAIDALAGRNWDATQPTDALPDEGHIAQQE